MYMRTCAHRPPPPHTHTHLHRDRQTKAPTDTHTNTYTPTETYTHTYTHRTTHTCTHLYIHDDTHRHVHMHMHTDSDFQNMTPSVWYSFRSFTKIFQFYKANIEVVCLAYINSNLRTCNSKDFLKNTCIYIISLARKD